MTKIVITGQLTDLNSYIKALNGSRWAGNAIKRSETEKVAWTAKVARIEPVAGYPVQITYRWYSVDKRKDLDNIAFSKKFINDGLVEAGVLEGDSRRFISGFKDEFFIDKDNPRVEIFIE